MKRLHFRNETSEGSPPIDMTPMLDIVFILLIFFIVSSTLEEDYVIEIDKPKSNSSDLAPTENISIKIDRHDNLWLRNKKILLEQLESEMNISKNISKFSSIIIEADKSATSGKLIEIVDYLKNLGEYEILVATDRKID